MLSSIRHCFPDLKRPTTAKIGLLRFAWGRCGSRSVEDKITEVFSWLIPIRF